MSLRENIDRDVMCYHICSWSEATKSHSSHVKVPCLDLWNSSFALVGATWSHSSHRWPWVKNLIWESAFPITILNLLTELILKYLDLKFFYNGIISLSLKSMLQIKCFKRLIKAIALETVQIFPSMIPVCALYSDAVYTSYLCWCWTNTSHIWT